MKFRCLQFRLSVCLHLPSPEVSENHVVGSFCEGSEGKNIILWNARVRARKVAFLVSTGDGFHYL